MAGGTAVKDVASREKEGLRREFWPLGSSLISG
jgi:hypothetical protein